MMAISRWTGREKPFLAKGTTKVDIWKLEKYELQLVMAGVTIRKAGAKCVRMTHTMVSTVHRRESLEDFKDGESYDEICILESKPWLQFLVKVEGEEE